MSDDMLYYHMVHIPSGKHYIKGINSDSIPDALDRGVFLGFLSQVMRWNSSSDKFKYWCGWNYTLATIPPDRNTVWKNRVEKIDDKNWRVIE